MRASGVSNSRREGHPSNALRALRERAVISVDDVSKRQNELHRFEAEHRDSSDQLRRLEAAFEEVNRDGVLVSN